MIIATDTDECLAQYITAFCLWHNEKYGTRLKEEDFTEWDISKTIGTTRQEELRRLYEFHKSTYFFAIQPVPGSVRGTKTLKERGNTLFVTTGRQLELRVETHEWIGLYYPEVFSGIQLGNHHSLNNQPKKPKSEMCDELEADALIEDTLATAIECAKPGRRVLLMNRPWNQNGKLPDGVQRVYSWEEIVEALNGKA